jgi:hypothetical protein
MVECSDELLQFDGAELAKVSPKVAIRTTPL